ncbi:hypothetical protein ACWCOT_07265 [Nonomuraea bangladeshensis]
MGKLTPALLCALAAPVLYLVVNLVAIQAAAHPARLQDPSNDWMLGPLERELAAARVWAFSVAFVLAAEAAFLGALNGWLNRRPSVARIVPRAVVGVGYLLTLALAIEVNPTSPLWELNDDSALDRLVPAWHFPALVAVGVVTLVAVAGWLVGVGRGRS